MRVKINESMTLSHIYYVEGEASNQTPPIGHVTATVKNLAGDVISTGSATQDEDNVYTYSYDLEAITELGKYQITWLGIITETTWVEIVGEHLFELQDLRTRLQSGAFNRTYTDAQLSTTRDVVADAFDNICGTSFARRRRVELVDARGTAGLVTSYGVAAVHTVNDAAYSGSYTRSGVVRGLPANQVCSVDYEACDSSDGTVPEDIRTAAIEYAIALLGTNTTNIPNNAETVTTDEATYRLVVPGQRGSFTGFPRVDAVLNRYKRRGNSRVVVV